MKRLFIVAALLAMLVVSSCGTTNTKSAPSELDRYLETQLDAMPATALAAGVVDADGLAWAGYYGTIDGSTPTSEDSLFMIASVSKLVIVTAAMQLWEQDRFALDDDINGHLPFEVRNPSHPGAPITFRHLMTHFSSIADSDVYLDLYTIDQGGGDSPWALGEFLEAYLVPGGELYSDQSYLDRAPGQYFEYSNTGAALLAYLVEEISGQDYADYCRDHVFRPLGMDHTYYRLSDIPASETELVTCYDGDEPLPHYSYPDYPSGAVRTTVADMARFCAFYLDPAGNDARILDADTVALMWGLCDAEGPCDMEFKALIWGHLGWMVPGAIGHTGGDIGVSTTLLLYPEEGFGTLLFMNEEPFTVSAERDINARIKHEGLALLG